MANQLAIDIHAPNLDARSDLLKAQSRALRGKVNACPFGCQWGDLDDNGYCRHLVGFTHNGKTMEPMIYDQSTGRRVVRVPKDADGRPQLERCKAGDTLVRISTGSRVYRPDAPGARPVKRTDAVEGDVDDVTNSQLAQLTRSAPGAPAFQTAPTEDFSIIGNQDEE